ncbi:helix-turn-helix domain-containing protein [Aquimarina spongiae]|uniref:Helix-turn-helix domain-containing protein n=1 Tax=Aquimarina spongiae TaxID=570521 RepID=A0A1M6GHI3_9FLAO|nr:helix-turn-helix domain-containing protein [Aquimarina spongiae]SHJ09427.1 Helix-turn-helix domain-containing protein [Aquimarina spongiae]
MTGISLIINILIIFGTCQAFFIAYVLLSSDRTAFKKLLATLLIVEGIILFERLLVETELINSMPHLLGIATPISFLKPPLLFFMALSITIQGFKLSKKSYLHFVVFCLMLVLNIPFYFLSGTEKLETVNRFMTKIPSYTSFEFYFFLSFFAYIGVYVFFGIKKLQQFKKQVTNNVLVNWYYTILISYSIFLLIHLIYFIFQPLGNYNFAVFNQVSMLAMTFLIQSIAYKLIDKTLIFTSKPTNLNNLTKRKNDQIRIVNLFEIDKIHLNDNLNLKIFSESVSLPSNYVSEIINQKFNCSFKKLVNQYRLKEAKEIIKRDKDNKLKLIEIAYDSGFNNKVSFYRVFKEFEGIAPSEYIKNLKS